jgi:EAL domain-containing protein (putative c-di-GMP-specific phosphodiesterase class I)
MKNPRRRRNVADAIFADEIGLEYGIYGPFRLRSAYQPIFQPRGRQLVPVAVEALIEPHVAGNAMPAADFFAGIAAADRLFIENMCRTLHLHNFRNVGAEGVDLFFNYDPRINDDPLRALAEIRFMAYHLEEYDLHPRMLVCEITEEGAPDAGVLRALVHELRRHGIRIAVDDFGAGHSTDERLRLVEPDIVKIDGPWFAQLCGNAAAGRLFASLVALLHERGAKVLVEGIEEPVQLRVALDSGADLLQGFLLGRPALAGSIFHGEALETAALLAEGGNIVPLRPKRQRR